jgi:formylmethanofuran dehydrogenase subunit A
MDLLRIAGGTIYDPANGIDGEVRDLWVREGRIVDAPGDPNVRPTSSLDAAGLVVMPGGIDMHCHIAGPKVNAGRRMLPAERRESEPVRRSGSSFSATMGSTPSSYATGYKYAGLGYTTAFDAAIAPLAARAAHLEFADTPIIDRGCYLLLGNNHYLMRAIGDRDHQRAKNFVGWLLCAGRGYAPKLVNPGGVEQWKQQPMAEPVGLETSIDGFNITPREIIFTVAQASNELNLPHPVHIHCNQLGLPGNWRTTLATMQALDGFRSHLTHIQFHSYAGGEGDEATFGSAVEPLVEYFNDHTNLSVDVGQILFGKTTSMTADSPAGHYLSRLYKTKWYSHDLEHEGGCGVAPIEYKQKSLVHAWQWAIGLEWFLLARDPWRIGLTTDHPNGGSFLSYPRIIRLLMDAAYRREQLDALPRKVCEQSALRSIDREYSLGEICILTRSGPARMLGLTNKGHLGAGADADITLYGPSADYEQMFQLPRHALKAGHFVIRDGELVAENSAGEPIFGRTLSVSPDYDRTAEEHIEAWFNKHYSIRFRNYAVANDSERWHFRN